MISLWCMLLISSNLLLISPRSLHTYELAAILFTNGFENRGILVIILDLGLLRLFESVSFGDLLICTRFILRAGATF